MRCAGLTEFVSVLHHWINDGLMAVFFFLVGLEIKREMLVGELASPRQAALPIAGALGGMLVPAGLSWSVTAGTILGLVLGKPIGITLFAWLATRVGVATLPSGASWRALVGVSLLGGIGFTMAIFIASLAFPQSPELLDSAKVGILAASFVAGLAGWALLRAGTSLSRAQANDDIAPLERWGSVPE